MSILKPSLMYFATLQRIQPLQVMSKIEILVLLWRAIFVLYRVMYIDVYCQILLFIYRPLVFLSICKYIRIKMQNGNQFTFFFNPLEQMHDLLLSPPSTLIRCTKTTCSFSAVLLNVSIHIQGGPQVQNELQIQNTSSRCF